MNRASACAGKVLVLVSALLSTLASAADVGSVVSVKGVVMMAGADSKPQAVFAGQPLPAKALLRTARNSTAFLRFEDGSRLLLRPETELIIEDYFHDREKAANSRFWLNLVKGGLRSVTGTLSQQNHDAYRLRTTVGVIGIRGTDYVARLCDSNCSNAAEGGEARRADIVARVGAVSGEVVGSGQPGGSEWRTLVVGAPVYRGEVLASAALATLTLVTPDDGRLTLLPGSALRIDRFDFDPGKPKAARVAMTLLGGRLVGGAGHIAEARHNGYRVEGANGAVDARGAAVFRVACTGACVTPLSGVPANEIAGGVQDLLEKIATDAASGSGFAGTAFAGSLQARGAGRDGIDIASGQTFTVTVAGSGTQPTTALQHADFLGGSSSWLTVDFNSAWGAAYGQPIVGGLYVAVFDGAVNMSNGRGQTPLGLGEAGYTGAEQVPQRLAAPPAFLLEDPAFVLPVTAAGSAECR